MSVSLHKGQGVSLRKMNMISPQSPSVLAGISTKRKRYSGQPVWQERGRV